MNLDLFVLHTSSPGSFEKLTDSNLNQRPASPISSLTWQTCLRKIILGWGDCNLVRERIAGVCDFQFYHGAAAYQFLLEVVCGLHSPIIGETEVFGQFKSDVLDVAKERGLTPQLQQALQKINADAKAVRVQFFANCGSQSYGSLCRKVIGKIENVDVLGTGKLAKEVLPWLLKERRQVCVYGRSVHNLQQVAKKWKNVQSRQLQDGLQSHALPRAIVIAAPLSAGEIEHLLMPFRDGIHLVIDLRGEAAHDPLSSGLPVADLKQVFAKLEEVRESLKEVVQKARIDIQGRAQAFALRLEHRPFGWEDVCA